ncbi:hypothetical protein FH972_026284 [Carpinus fangiana]|uniref:Type 1 phosphatases regulator n=1 Tax=Carpinus fangiana TaxID=176857 RepID=A0A5N6L3W9_9ROSI|nr:hypothetical protein FH972_026284 [Carpinus fangiana]
MTARARDNLRAGTYASATQTINSTPTQSGHSDQARSDPFPINVPPSGTLRLRAEASSDPATQTTVQEPAQDERRVQWAESVINNEGMGKKSSKVCCIYHKPREAGESSEEDSSDSSSDDDSDVDDGAARPARRKDEDREHGEGGECSGHNHAKVKRRNNAYERQPKNT